MGPRDGHWLCRRHVHHHVAEPLRNHGVTSPPRDHVFRTFSAADTVTGPRRPALRWLLDGDGGEVLPDHRPSTPCRGRATRLTPGERDRAFANLAPLDDDVVLTG